MKVWQLLMVVVAGILVLGCDQDSRQHKSGQNGKSMEKSSETSEIIPTGGGYGDEVRDDNNETDDEGEEAAEY